MPAPVIDAHQHFWDPSTGSCGWMTEDYAPIRRVFAPADLEPELKANGIDATVLVQTWHDTRETEDFLAVAASHDFVAGVVGWVDLTDPDVGWTLARLKAWPLGRFLVAIRHLVHNEDDADWLLREDVRRGLKAVSRAGLAYDLLIRAREIPAALRTVADFPSLRFVIDHIAKPNIRTAAFQPWATLMRSFAIHRSHVWCKLSGMVTEADWKAWRPVDLKPYVHEVVDIFGPDRCMFGSDWPVSLMAARYSDVKSALLANLEGLTQTERDQVFGGSAIQAYELPDFITSARR